MDRVAIMVPLSFRTERTPEEEISFRHLVRFLGRYDRYVVVPEGTSVAWSGFEVEAFPREYFGSAQAHTRLLFSRRFYERFSRYEYLLTYHLDCLVFDDQLEAWCSRGLDYIGAPWFRNEDTPWVGEPFVGNGGFSLRRIPAMLQVLDSRRRTEDPEAYWRRFAAGRSWPSRAANLPRRYLKRWRRWNGIQRHMAVWGGNEDLFWARYARHYHPGFRIADFQTALRFAFEAAPRRCFELNDRQLPFGCHAWFRYDRAFWEPHLLSEAVVHAT